MTCPHLDYRSQADGRSFDRDRAFCEVAGAFVEPMRADVCNDRYALHHVGDCEI